MILSLWYFASGLLPLLTDAARAIAAAAAAAPALTPDVIATPLILLLMEPQSAPATLPGATAARAAGHYHEFVPL